MLRSTQNSHTNSTSADAYRQLRTVADTSTRGALQEARLLTDQYDRELTPRIWDDYRTTSRQLDQLDEAVDDLLTEGRRDSRRNRRRARDLTAQAEADEVNLLSLASMRGGRALNGMRSEEAFETAAQIAREMDIERVERSMRAMDHQGRVSDEGWASLKRARDVVVQQAAVRRLHLSEAAHQAGQRATTLVEYLESRVDFMARIIDKISELQLRDREQATEEFKVMSEHQLSSDRQKLEALYERKQQELEAARHRNQYDLRASSQRHEESMDIRRQNFAEKRQADDAELDRLECRLRSRGLLSRISS